MSADVPQNWPKAVFEVMPVFDYLDESYNEGRGELIGYRVWIRFGSHHMAMATVADERTANNMRDTLIQYFSYKPPA